jgi:hypothetical protein
MSVVEGKILYVKKGDFYSPVVKILDALIKLTGGYHICRCNETDTKFGGSSDNIRRSFKSVDVARNCNLITTAEDNVYSEYGPKRHVSISVLGTDHKQVADDVKTRFEEIEFEEVTVKPLK